MGKSVKTKAVANPLVIDEDMFPDIGDIDATAAPKAKAPTVEEDELLDVRVGATVTDGEFTATLVDIKPVPTNYTVEETSIVAGVKTTKIVPKTGKVYNFMWKLEDGRTLIDPRFTRDFDEPAKKFQSINIALGNIATQLKRTTLTMRELLTEKPTLKVWVSRVGKNRNVDYLKPLAKPVALNMGAAQPPL